MIRNKVNCVENQFFNACYSKFVMIHTIKIGASILATTVALVAYVPYLIAMFRGNNRPHLYTWISIFLITTIVAYLQVIGGAGIGAIPTIIGVGIDGIILFYCFKFGTKDIVFIDKVCLTITVIGVITYLVLHNHPAASLAVVTVAEIISFLPTFRKTKNDPYSESLPSYYLVILKLILILVALEKYNVLTASYSVIWIIVLGLFIILVYAWRKKIKPYSNPMHHGGSAPLL